MKTIKTILFCPEGIAVSDFEISQYVDKMILSEEKEFKISSSLIIDEIRARIRSNELDINFFSIFVTDFKNKVTHFKIDENGKSRDWVDSLNVAEYLYGRLI